MKTLTESPGFGDAGEKTREAVAARAGVAIADITKLKATACMIARGRFRMFNKFTVRMISHDPHRNA
jgi:hypothetical protein